MLSFQIDNELTKQLIALNEAISEKNALLGAISSQDREAIHHYAWISMVGASTRIENAILTDSEIDWLDSVLGKDAKKTAFDANRKPCGTLSLGTMKLFTKNHGLLQLLVNLFFVF
ncbi:MAG: hypothetical protein AABY64_13230 [Bdellovibrionota bacterium]